MVRSGVSFFILLLSSAWVMLGVNARPGSAGKGKNPHRLRGAGCDPLDSLFGQRSRPVSR